MFSVDYSHDIGKRIDMMRSHRNQSTVKDVYYKIEDFTPLRTEVGMFTGVPAVSQLTEVRLKALSARTMQVSHFRY